MAKTFLQRRFEELRSYGLVATLGELSQWGPLGQQKTRRQLGRSLDLVPPTALGTRRNQEEPTLIDTGADNKDELSIGDALAQQVVITCTVQFPTNASADTRVCNIIGTLDWGGDGHAGSVDFDFRNGTVIRPVGGSFRVSARYALDALGNQPTVPVRVGAWVGYGSPHGPWGCTLTERVGTLPGSLRVPPFADYLTAYAQDDALTVDWYAGANLVGSVALAAGSAGVKLPVPGGGVSRVQFSSTATAVLAVWSLAL